MSVSKVCPSCKGNGHFLGNSHDTMYCDDCGGAGTMKAFCFVQLRNQLTEKHKEEIERLRKDIEILFGVGE
jgi:DnaJ-class molecular chaperone